MKTRLLFFILLLTVGFIAPLPGQAARAEKRFLFIIETSSETKKSAANIRDSLLALFGSGMGGLMENGDTFGIWTFNNELYPGKIGMQTWKTNETSEMVQRMDQFLKLQRYEKNPKLETVLRPMYSVVQSSPTITVVLVTSGKNQIQGTPFDSDINEFWKNNAREFQKKKIPFLTMLLAQNGKILRHSVGPAIGDIRIPKPLPPAPVVAQKIKPALVKPAVTNEIKTPIVPTPTTDKAVLISKSGTQRISATVLAEQLETAHTNVVKTNEIAVIAPAEKPVSPPQAVKISAAPPAVTNTLAVSTNATKPEPQKLASGATNPTVTLARAPANAAPTNQTQTSAAVPEITKIEPQKNPEQKIVSASTTAIPETAEKLKTNAPAPAPEIKTNQSSVENPTSAPNEIASKDPNLAPEIAASSVSSKPANSRIFLYSALGLMLVGVVLAFLIGRHSSGKRSSQSIISDSFDRKK